MASGRLKPEKRSRLLEVPRDSVPQSISSHLQTTAGRAVAAAIFVISAMTGLVTNLVTGQRGWGLVAGAAALVAIVTCGAAMAWFQQASQERSGTAMTAPDPAHLELSSAAPPWGLLPAEVRGRDALIEELSGLASSPDGRVHVLSGLGGNGKTTVALAVASLARESGQAWWISGRDQASVDSGLLDLASALGVTGAELEQARAGRRSVTDLVWGRLEASTLRWILVVDNADAPELLAADEGKVRDGNGVTRGSQHGLTLATSRNGDKRVWGDGTVIHRIGPLGVEDAADVLVDLSGPSAGSRHAAVVLAERLGGLPLALRAAGHYLSSTAARLGGVRTFAAYQAELDARFAVLQGPVLPDSDPREIVMTTWEVSLDLLATRGQPDARPFMRIVGQFAPAPIPVEILNPEILGASGLLSAVTRSRWRRRKGRSQFGKHDLDQIILAVSSLGLLDMTDYVPVPRTGIRLPCPPAIPCIVAHPLVVEVNAEALKREKAVQQTVVTTIVELVSAAAERADTRSPEDAATWPLLAPHIELLAASVLNLPASDVVRFAEAANRTATGLRHGGDFSAALHLIIRARDAVGQLAPEHPAVLALRHSYAYFIDDLGRFAEAEAEYRTILAARVRSLGDRDPLTLTTRSHLAFALSRQGKYQEAEAEYRHVLQARHELLGPEHQDTLTTRNNLGDVLYGQRRYDEAAEHYEQVLQAQLQLLGPDHPRTLTTRNNLARNRSRQGQYHEAENDLRAILRLRRDSRGAEHPSTLATWHDLATTLAMEGKSDEAKQEFLGILDARRRVLGENHPDTLATATQFEKTTSAAAATPGPRNEDS
jgi:tetratricopeptide (TPR) repeat protein